VSKTPGPPEVEEGGKAQPFEEFLRAEYTNIAQAHFNTSQSISEFFKAYIALVSLPISAAVIFLKPKELRESGILDVLLAHPGLVAAGLGGVTLIGLLVLGYVVNLRCDAVLYARTVNGIRKFFYDAGPLDLETEQRYRVLPKRTQTPRYWESYYFLFVVLAFAGVGTGYWASGLYFYFTATSQALDWRFWVLVGACPGVHLLLYRRLARYRERRYLKSRILGIDIDGVLNSHREQFCTILHERTGKRLAPEAITRIPVHEIPGCGVDEKDEWAVFNWPTYWTEMPEAPKAAEMVRRIRNGLGYHIWLFTYRPWPHPEWYERARVGEYRRAWRKTSRWSRYALARLTRWVELGLNGHQIPELFGFWPIRSVTKSWLRAKGFPYDRLVVERGNTDTRDPLFLTRNRFVISADKEIRAFVEDDLNKARRLADVCDVVFLVDHPYNREAAELPKNVVRVSHWGQIHDYLRRRL
jgi:uncharacterized HAD superfamily protein